MDVIVEWKNIADHGGHWNRVQLNIGKRWNRSELMSERRLPEEDLENHGLNGSSSQRYVTPVHEKQAWLPDELHNVAA